MNHKFPYFTLIFMLITILLITTSVESRSKSSNRRKSSKRNSSNTDVLENEKLHYYQFPIQCNNRHLYSKPAEHCNRNLRPIHPVGQAQIGTITKELMKITEDQNNLIWIEISYLNYSIINPSDNDKTLRILLPYQCKTDTKNRGILKHVNNVNEIDITSTTSENPIRELMKIVVNENGTSAAELHTAKC